MSFLSKRNVCQHTLLKCPDCGKFEDNIFIEERSYIATLELMLDYYEVNFPLYQPDMEAISGKIEEQTKILKLQLNHHDRPTDEPND